jgi:protein SCO1/2
MKALAALAFVAAAAAHAQPLALPAPPAAQLEQRLGQPIPLDMSARDETGAPVRFAAYFGGRRAVLLVPGYYRCTQLCGLVMHGLLETLRESGVPPAQWRIVAFSIDPGDTPADARARLTTFDAGAADLHLLVLPPADARRLARDLGYSFRPAAEGGYAHPASVALLTPHGVVSHYFNGLDFDPGQMRVALADASGDRVGGVTARLALLCAHFDPHVGRHSAAIMDAIRAGALLLVAMLAAWMWRRR